MAIPGFKKDAVPTVVNLIPKSNQTEETLITMYSERIGELNEHIANRLREYMMYVQKARKDEGDWFFWFHKAIMDVATKTTTEQRNIAYLIGVFKAWLNYGFGTYYNAEFYKAKELFTKRFGIEPSKACATKLNDLVQRFGLVYMVDSVLSCEPEKVTDPSMVIAIACEEYAESIYGKMEDTHEHK